MKQNVQKLSTNPPGSTTRTRYSTTLDQLNIILDRLNILGYVYQFTKCELGWCDHIQCPGIKVNIHEMIGAENVEANIYCLQSPDGKIQGYYLEFWDDINCDKSK